MTIKSSTTFEIPNCTPKRGDADRSGLERDLGTWKGRRCEKRGSHKIMLSRSRSPWHYTKIMSALIPIQIQQKGVSSPVEHFQLCQLSQAEPFKAPMQSCRSPLCNSTARPFSTHDGAGRSQNDAQRRGRCITRPLSILFATVIGLPYRCAPKKDLSSVFQELHNPSDWWGNSLEGN